MFLYFFFSLIHTYTSISVHNFNVALLTCLWNANAFRRFLSFSSVAFSFFSLITKSNNRIDTVRWSKSSWILIDEITGAVLLFFFLSFLQCSLIRSQSELDDDEWGNKCVRTYDFMVIWFIVSFFFSRRRATRCDVLLNASVAAFQHDVQFTTTCFPTFFHSLFSLLSILFHRWFS